jgi:hypothetical protein
MARLFQTHLYNESMTFLLQLPGAMEWIILYVVHFLLASFFLAVWGAYYVLRTPSRRNASKHP